MPRMIQRKYRCGTCGHEWTGIHYKKTEPNLPCPACENPAEVQHREGLKEIIESGQAPVMRSNSNVSKAADMCGRMLEDDYGIPPSLINDNAREGDSYVKVPSSVTKAQYLGQADSTQQVTESFLAQARSGGTLGEHGLNGFEIAKGAAKVGNIPDPRKNMIMMQTKDKV